MAGLEDLMLLSERARVTMEGIFEVRFNGGYLHLPAEVVFQHPFSYYGHLERNTVHDTRILTIFYTRHVTDPVEVTARVYAIKNNASPFQNLPPDGVVEKVVFNLFPSVSRSQAAAHIMVSNGLGNAYVFTVGYNPNLNRRNETEIDLQDEIRKQVGAARKRQVF